MDNNFNKSISRAKTKTREIFSFALKIPLQTEVLNAALKKYCAERNLDSACSKTDFLIYVLRGYLNDETPQLKELINALSQKLDVESKRIALDVNSSHMQQFERALIRRTKAKLSTSREDFICHLFRYTRSRADKDQLLND